jgi:hypothetical protein
MLKNAHILEPFEATFFEMFKNKIQLRCEKCVEINRLYLKVRICLINYYLLLYNQTVMWAAKKQLWKDKAIRNIQPSPDT